MSTSHGTGVARRRQRRVAASPRPNHIAGSVLAHRVAALSGAGATDTSSSLRLAIRRSQAAVHVARVQNRQLQRLVEERERERDLALADSTELRLRHARLAACYFAVEVGRQPPATAAAALSVPPAGPWYRRFWLAMIGKDVRAGEWGASARTP